MTRHVRPFIIGLSAILAPAIAAAWAVRGDDSEAEPIRYSATQPNDPIARLQKQIDSGEVILTYESGKGYLPSLLKALKIPTSSQMLVFSRNSFQRAYISPQTPR